MEGWELVRTAEDPAEDGSGGSCRQAACGSCRSEAVKSREVKGGWTNLRLPVLKLFLTHCTSASSLRLNLTLIRGVLEGRRRGLRRHSHHLARWAGRLYGRDDVFVSRGGGELFVQGGDGRASDGHLTEPMTTPKHSSCRLVRGRARKPISSSNQTHVRGAMGSVVLEAVGV